MLGTGRCGSLSFARACEHFSNYTVGHESRARLAGEDRLTFADQHVEVDNRLSWFLGPLGDRYDGYDTFWVHLTRPRDAVVDSFLRRWDSDFRANIIRAFAHGILMRTEDWDAELRRVVVQTYVDTVSSNIREFLKKRPSIQIELDDAESKFKEFADRINAKCSIDDATSEFKQFHNASR